MLFSWYNFLDGERLIMAEKKKKKETKKKVKKPKHILGKKEFAFNFISLVCMIGVGIYFGYRSLYYYSKQNQQIQEEAQTLNGFIIQNSTVVSDEEVGLHHDSNGYFYKGAVDNNYVLFANRLFRIIRIQEDNTVRLVLDTYAGVFPWGDPIAYRDSNVYYWLNHTDWDASGYYYDTLPSVEEFLVKTEYQINTLEDGQIRSGEEKYQDYISLLDIHDYVMANGMLSYLNNGKMFFLLGLGQDGRNMYVDEDGSIQTCDSTEGYGVRPVITLKANTIITGGDGTKTNPFVIYQGDKVNYVGTYVKLGEDIWQVFYQKDSILKLSLNGYLYENGQEKLISYSQNNSIYDIMKRGNIGNYLNYVYLPSLSYQNVLLPFASYTGEISDDQGYQYSNIYSNQVVSHVGLLNVFDPIFNDTLTDYYHVNTTSPIGSMEYVTFSNGMLGEGDVRDEKHIVPVISIDASGISAGDGSLQNPFIVG